MALIAVGSGAFGAHFLEDILLENQRVETWNTAVQYHFYHSIAILISSLLIHHFSNRNIQRAVYAFLLGIIFFSGSLYTLCLTDITFLGAITPVGGVFFILGWLLLAVGAVRKFENRILVLQRTIYWKMS